MYIQNSVGTRIHAKKTADAKIMIDQVCFTMKGDGILRAGLGTGPALVTQMNPVVAGHGKPALDAQGRFCRIHFPEVGKGTCQFTGPAPGTSFVNSSQFQSQGLPYEYLFKSWLSEQANGIFLQLRSLRRP
jgi:hypothetical protein